MTSGEDAALGRPDADITFEYQHLLKHVRVGEPIRSWINPRFEVKGHTICGTGGGGMAAVIKWTQYALRLIINTFDSDFRRKRLIELHVTAPVGSGLSDSQFLELLRKELHYLFCHEVDEALTFKGEKIFDPHK